MNLFAWFKEPPAATPLTDSNEIAKTYKHYRIRIFYACFIGYTVYHFVKKNSSNITSFWWQISIPDYTNLYSEKQSKVLCTRIMNHV